MCCLFHSMDIWGSAQGLGSSHYITPAPVTALPWISWSLLERPSNLKLYYLAYDGSLLITCLPVKALYYWLWSQTHFFSFPVTTIFASRGALLTRVFLARLDVGWLHFADTHSPCCAVETGPYHFCIPSWRGVWLCSIFFFFPHFRKNRIELLYGWK